MQSSVYLALCIHRKKTTREFTTAFLAGGLSGNDGQKEEQQTTVWLVVTAGYIVDPWLNLLAKGHRHLHVLLPHHLQFPINSPKAISYHSYWHSMKKDINKELYIQTYKH